MEKSKTVYIPQRMCAGCRCMADKPDLIRVVIQNDSLVIDNRHKIQARGIYLCAKEQCILASQKRKVFSRALKRQVSDEFYKELMNCAAR